MAKTKRRSKKKQKVSSAVVSFMILIVTFALLVTGNTFLNFSQDIPTWYTLKNELDSYFEIPQKGQPVMQPVVVDGQMKVHFIDVGQGNCTLIQANGANILIDAGENDQGEKVVRYLQQQGVTQIDYAVGTHPHSDHIGGMDVVINQIPVSNIILPELKASLTPTTRTYEDLITAIQTQGVTVLKANLGDIYEIGGGTMKILGPTGDYDDLNEISVGVKYSFGNRSILITGDMEKKGEQGLVASGEDLSADIYLLGHHGSRTSNSEEMLDLIRAKYFVAEMGYNNEYGHPHQEVLDRVSSRGGILLRSDLHGTVVFTVSGDQIEYRTEKGQ